MRPARAAFALLAAAMLLAGCGGAGGGGGKSEPSGPARAERCEPERAVTEQSGGHLLGEATPAQPYNSVPPTSGWHAAGKPRYGVHGADAPLREAEQVTVLELGGVVLAYRDLDAAQRSELEALARAHDGVVAVTPYERLEPGEVAMTAWGTLRRCRGVDAEAIAAFIAAHRGGGPAH